MQTTIDGQKLDISRLSGEVARVNANNKRLDDTNKRLELAIGNLERDKGQLTSQLGYFTDYYNKSQQADHDFGVAIDTAQGAVSSALDDLRSIQVNQ